jgi:hypothetical protein
MVTEGLPALVCSCSHVLGAALLRHAVRCIGHVGIVQYNNTPRTQDRLQFKDDDDAGDGTGRDRGSNGGGHGGIKRR